jgi:hypothetical protein
VGKRRWLLSSIKGIGGTECLDGGEPLKPKIVYAQRVRLDDRWCRRWTAARQHRADLQTGGRGGLVCRLGSWTR